MDGKYLVIIFFLLHLLPHFFYFWVPDYLFQALSTFNWMTWIKPDNQNLAVVTGSLGGLGLNQLLLLIGIISVLCFNHFKFHSFIQLIILLVWLLHSSVSSVFGILIINGQDIYQSTIMVFTNTGEPYSVRLVVDANSLFDKEKYAEMGPPFYTAANLVVYGAFLPFTHSTLFTNLV